MAGAHVPGFDQGQGSSPQLTGAAQQQDTSVPQHGQASMRQTMNGMSQSLADKPAREGFVDQQSASLGGADPQHEQSMTAPRQQEASMTTAGESGSQQGGGTLGSPADQVREHMEVIGADEVHLGTVDKVEGERIKLTKADSGMGSHQGHHHYISRGLVAAVEGNRVRLSATAANAYAMEEEE
jgi:hypothetical protein